jgi:hypothetical protein
MNKRNVHHLLSVTIIRITKTTKTIRYRHVEDNNQQTRKMCVRESSINLNSCMV